MAEQPIDKTDWLDKKGKNPHQRLDVFVGLWSAHMEWAKSANASLDALAARMEPDKAEAVAISESLRAAVILQVAHSDTMRDLQNGKDGAPGIADHRMTIKSLTEDQKTIRANLSLMAGGKNDDQRRDNLLRAQADSEDYQKIREGLYAAERAKLEKQAHFDHAEREYKRLGEQIKNLRARLQHWTARARMTQGE